MSGNQPWSGNQPFMYVSHTPPPLVPPTLPLRAGVLRRATVPLSWVALLVPLIFTVLRFSLGVAGWVMIFYWFTGFWIFLIVQAVVANLIQKRARRTSPPAAGTVTTMFMWLAILFHLSLAFLIGDAGDAPGSGMPLFVESAWGWSGDVTNGLFITALLVWAVCHVAAAIAAAMEAQWPALQNKAARENSYR